MPKTKNSESMSNGSEDEELDEILKRARIQTMADSLDRIKKLLTVRANKTVENNNKGRLDPRRARAALHAAQDLYYLLELFELVANLNGENQMLKEAIDVLAEKCSLIDLPPEQKKDFN